MSPPLPSGAAAVDRLTASTEGTDLGTMVVEACHPHATAIDPATQAVLAVWLVKAPVPPTRPGGAR